MSLNIDTSGDKKKKVDIARNAMGGTELMMKALKESVPGPLLDQFQIIPSRVLELQDEKNIILWLHDLPNDPESQHLKDGGWELFEKLVFVSSWQQQQYFTFIGVPFGAGEVIQNAIQPFGEINKPDVKDCVKIIYHTTPHRGLNILVPVFNHLYKSCKAAGINIELDVYSSFELYGWPERDEEFKDLFQTCRDSDGINYHGSVSNDEVRKALEQAHIFAYPSTWPETSCIALIEAAAAGCMCVHPNYGALPETAANWTQMYGMEDNPQNHANKFAENLQRSIEVIYQGGLTDRLGHQSDYFNGFYSWNVRSIQWNAFLEGQLGS